MEPPVVAHAVITTRLSKRVESGLRAAHHGDDHGLVQAHDRTRIEGQQDVIEGDDLWPVGALGVDGLVVHRSDGCLYLVDNDRPMG